MKQDQDATMLQAGPARVTCSIRARASSGRLLPEPPSATRSEFQRDRDRIIHSSAFRRLALKTQVFLPDEGDNYRTRLTHTIEVAQIARTVSRALGLDEDLTEALALAHDLGHPPFGHTGEQALDRAVAAAGGFDHNQQTLRIVTELEKRYPTFDGLNLTWETLEGLVKRKGPLLRRGASEVDRSGLPTLVRALDTRFPLALDTFAGAEAQAAAIADEIAYNAHDLEDGLDAGLFELDDLREVDFLGSVLARIAREAPGLGRERSVRAMARTMVGLFVEDAIAESHRRLDRAEPADGWALRRLNHPAVALSPEFAEASRTVKRFLFARMYRHPRIVKVREQSAAIVSDLARHLTARPADLPAPWAGQEIAGPGTIATMRLVADYVAGLTDRGAVAEHRRLFPTTPDLR